MTSAKKATFESEKSLKSPAPQKLMRSSLEALPDQNRFLKTASSTTNNRRSLQRLPSDHTAASRSLMQTQKLEEGQLRKGTALSKASRDNNIAPQMLVLPEAKGKMLTISGGAVKERHRSDHKGATMATKLPGPLS